MSTEKMPPSAKASFVYMPPSMQAHATFVLGTARGLDRTVQLNPMEQLIASGARRKAAQRVLVQLRRACSHQG